MEYSGNQDVRVSPARAFANQQARNLFIEICAMFVATLLCWGLYVGNNSDAVNYVAPTLVILILGAANMHMFQQDQYTLLTPLFALRLMAVLIFGIGGLLHNFITPLAQASVDQILIASQDDVARVHMMWLVSMDGVLVGALAGMKIFAGIRIRPSQFAAKISFNFALALFWIGFVLTIVLARISALPIPTIVPTGLLAVQLAGLFLMGRLARPNLSSVAWIGLALLALTLAALFLMFKAVALVPMLMLALGLIYARFSWLRVVLSMFLISVLYFFLLAPAVGALRGQQSEAVGDWATVSFSSQAENIVTYFERGGQQEVTDGSAALRFDYTVPAAFAMNQYDAGFPLGSLSRAGEALIPRIMWPEKPNTTISDEINYRMGFQYANNIGVTAFGDLYWNAGWLGLSLTLLIGLYNSLITIVSRELLRLEDWIMLPFVMLTFRTAMSIDGEFVASILIPVVIHLAFFLALRWLSGFLSGGTSVRRGTA